MRDRYRVCCLLVVLLAIGGVCVGYATVDVWTYPDPTEVADDPAAHDGERVLFFGDVRSVDSETGLVEMDVETDEDPLAVTVTGVDPAVLEDLEPGGYLQAHGAVATETTTGVDPATPDESRTHDDGGPTATDASIGGASTMVAAEGAVVDYRHVRDRLYTYAASILGAGLAAGAFLRRWRIDARRLRFEPRGGR